MSDFDDFLAGLQAKLENKATGTEAADAFVEEGTDLQRRAPNAIAWIAGANFLNQPSIYEHRRQYQVVRDFFQLRCPVCNTGDPDCWHRTSDELREEVLLEYDEAIAEDACPGCKLTRSELLEDGLIKAYDTMIGIAGMRSGKSVVAGMIGTYMRHVYVTLGIAYRGAIHDYFDILATQNLALDFVASSATQSKDTIWANFFNQCANSPWFQKYRTWVVRKMGQQSKTKGIKNWRYNENQDSIEDEWCMFNCTSLHSNSGSLAGRTRLGFLLDELSRFNTTESKMSADEVWAVFDHSLKTVKGARIIKKLKDRWLGTSIAITSPISIDDKAMQLYAVAQDIDNHYAWKYATWDFNPKQPRSNFDEDFAKDSVKAERDFGANPPNASSPLIISPHSYWAAIDTTAVPSVTFKQYTHADNAGREYLAANLEHAYIDGSRPLYIFGDAGLAFDQFALVACSAVWLPAGQNKNADEFRQDKVYNHFHPNEQVKEGELTLVCYHEWSLRIIPEKGKPVWFESVIDIIRALLQRRNIAMAAFDHWNSQSTLQQLGQLGIAGQTMRLTVDDFSRAVQDAYLGRLRLLPPEADDGIKLDPAGTLVMSRPAEQISASACTLYEMLKLERTADLKRVFNPRKGEVSGRNSDDLANCLVGAHRLVQESMGRTKNNDPRAERLAREKAGEVRFRGSIGRGL